MYQGYQQGQYTGGQYGSVGGQPQQQQQQNQQQQGGPPPPPAAPGYAQQQYGAPLPQYGAVPPQQQAYGGPPSSYPSTGPPPQGGPPQQALPYSAAPPQQGYAAPPPRQGGYDAASYGGGPAGGQYGSSGGGAPSAPTGAPQAQYGGVPPPQGYGGQQQMPPPQYGAPPPAYGSSAPLPPQQQQYAAAPPSQQAYDPRRGPPPQQGVAPLAQHAHHAQYPPPAQQQGYYAQAPPPSAPQQPGAPYGGPPPPGDGYRGPPTQQGYQTAPLAAGPPLPQRGGGKAGGPPPPQHAQHAPHVPHGPSRGGIDRAPPQDDWYGVIGKDGGRRERPRGGKERAARRGGPPAPDPRDRDRGGKDWDRDQRGGSSRDQKSSRDFSVDRDRGLSSRDYPPQKRGGPPPPAYDDSSSRRRERRGPGSPPASQKGGGAYAGVRDRDGRPSELRPAKAQRSGRVLSTSPQPPSPPSYAVHVPTYQLGAVAAMDRLETSRRFERLVIPADFVKSELRWAVGPQPALEEQGESALCRAFKLDCPLPAHHEISAAKVDSGPLAESDPRGAPPTAPEPGSVVYNARVVLLSGLSEEDRAAAVEGPARAGGDHVSRMIKFIVARAERSGVKSGIFALGGRCDPATDGDPEDPAAGTAALIRAATRHVSIQVGIDLGRCASWRRLLDLHYFRPPADSKRKSADEVESGGYREITAVFVVDDAQAAMPAAEEWSAAWEARHAQRPVPPAMIPVQVEEESAPGGVKSAAEEGGDVEDGELPDVAPLPPPEDPAAAEKPAGRKGGGSKVAAMPATPRLLLMGLHNAVLRLKTMPISLDGLLDYNESDTEEATFELSLLAEAFHEMVSRDAGDSILRAFKQQPWEAFAAARAAAEAAAAANGGGGAAKRKKEVPAGEGEEAAKRVKTGQVEAEALAAEIPATQPQPPEQITDGHGMGIASVGAPEGEQEQQELGGVAEGGDADAFIAVEEEKEIEKEGFGGGDGEDDAEGEDAVAMEEVEGEGAQAGGEGGAIAGAADASGLGGAVEAAAAVLENAGQGERDAVHLTGEDGGDGGEAAMVVAAEEEKEGDAGAAAADGAGDTPPSAGAEEESAAAALASVEAGKAEEGGAAAGAAVGAEGAETVEITEMPAPLTDLVLAFSYFDAAGAGYLLMDDVQCVIESLGRSLHRTVARKYCLRAARAGVAQPAKGEKPAHVTKVDYRRLCGLK